jgi:predicted lipoprotein with Yx(FWY)xxD motif
MNVQQKNGFRLERALGRHFDSRAILLMVSALAFTLGGCSSSGSPSAVAATTPVASASATASTAGGEGSHVTVWTLSSANKAGIGPYLSAEATTGQDALAVYTFKNDTPDSGASACDATCAKTWPPLVLTEGATVRVGGVTGKVAQLTRSDGTVQVTYNGAPLYFYVNDHSAGDTNGAGVSPSWSAATP